MEKIVYALKSIQNGLEHNAVLTFDENKKITVDFSFDRTIFLSLRRIKNRFSKATSFEKNLCFKNLFIEEETWENEKLVLTNRIDFYEFMPDFDEKRNALFYVG